MQPCCSIVGDRWFPVRTIARALEGSTRAVAYEAAVAGHLDRLFDAEYRKTLPNVALEYMDQVARQRMVSDYAPLEDKDQGLEIARMYVAGTEEACRRLSVLSLLVNGPWQENCEGADTFFLTSALVDMTKDRSDRLGAQMAWGFLYAMMRGAPLTE
jgi:hypothetical protein